MNYILCYAFTLFTYIDIKNTEYKKLFENYQKKNI